MKKRLIHEIKIYFYCILTFIIYYFFSKSTDIYIPCIFRKITGFKCPGCGITHMVFNLLNLNIKDAFNDNPLAFIYLPFILIYFLYNSYLYVMDRKDNTLIRIPRVLEIILIIITLLYGVIRNIYNF